VAGGAKQSGDVMPLIKNAIFTVDQGDGKYGPSLYFDDLGKCWRDLKKPIGGKCFKTAVHPTTYFFGKNQVKRIQQEHPVDAKGKPLEGYLQSLKDWQRDQKLKPPKKAKSVNPSLMKKAQFAMQAGYLRDAGSATKAQIESAYKKAKAGTRPSKGFGDRDYMLAYSVKIQQTNKRWKTDKSSLTLKEAKTRARGLRKQGYYPAVFDGRKKVWEPK
jgi:hypothetical protein